MPTDHYTMPLPYRGADPMQMATSADERLNWLLMSRERGEAWLAAQRSSIDVQSAMDLISGLDAETVPDAQMSDVRSGEIKRDLSELIAELANLRAEGHIKTDNKEFYDQAAVFQKRYRAWFQMTRVRRKVRSAIAYAATLGTGGLVAEYDPTYFGPGRGETNLRPCGPHGMIPDGLPPDGDYQRAYAVHLIEEVPIHDARARHPLFAAKIQPDRGMPSGWAKRMASFSRWLSPVLNYFGVRGEKPQDAVSNAPTVDLVTTYIRDYSLNLTNDTMVMGQPGTTWEVAVPPLGAMLPTGIKDTEGRMTFRTANADDAKLYPNRRQVIWCKSCVIKDDNSPYWHGRVPLFRFKLEDWPWESNGISVLKDVACLGRSQTRIMRAIEDSVIARLNPAMFYDDTAFSENAEELINPRIPGQRVRANLSLGGEMIKPMLPAQYYDVPQQTMDWVWKLGDVIKRKMFIQDVEAMAKARGIPGADALEKMLEQAGPVVRDLLEAIEDSMNECGTMLLSNFIQFDSLNRRLELLGDDGFTREDFDYEPGTLVPSHLEGEDIRRASDTPMIERARKHAKRFYFYITPGSLHELSRNSAKLMVLQAMKAGLKLDQWTLAKYFSIPYYGPEPEGAHTVVERLMAEERMKEEAAARMAQATGQGDGEGPGAGRPATHAHEPRMVQKDGGTRTTMATSR